MKRLIFALFAAAFISGAAYAVDFDLFRFPPSINERDIIINTGVGFVNVNWSDASVLIPPLFLHAEYALPIGAPISVGLGFAFYQLEWGCCREFGYRLTIFDIFARANWHFGLGIDRLDLYTGVSLGFSAVNTTFLGDWMEVAQNPASNRFLVNWQFGARFFFTNNIGVVVETGWPYVIKGGLTVRL